MGLKVPLPHTRAVVVPLLLEIDNAHGVGGLLGIALQVLLGQPAFHTAATLVGLDESDGDVQGTVDQLGKEIARCRELADGLGRALAPIGVGIVLRLHAHDAGYLGRAYLTLACSVDDFLVVVQHRAVAKALDGHLHVRLSGTYPYLASQHVADGQLSVAVVEGDGKGRVAGLGRLHRQQPAALPVGLGLAALVGPRRRSHYLAACLGPAPQADVRLLLDNHVVTHQMRESHLCLQSHGQCHQDSRKEIFYS